VADKTSDAEEKRFSVELRKFIEAHGRRGRGAQQWFANMIGGNRKKGQVSSWVAAKLIPGERAWDDVEKSLAGKEGVLHALLPPLAETRRASFSARQARERAEEAARLAALGAPTVVAHPFSDLDEHALHALAQFDPQAATRQIETWRAAIRTDAAERGLPEADDAAVLAAMVADPILIERPLVETDKGVRLCRPQDVVLEIL
jgi:hypothetical protein